jgi:hypothetical protein
VRNVIQPEEYAELLAFLDKGNNRNEIMREIVERRRDAIGRVQAAIGTDATLWGRLKAQHIIRPVTPPAVVATPPAVTPAVTPPAALTCCGVALKNYGRPGFHPRCPKCRRIVP